MSSIQDNKAVVADFLSTFSTGDVAAILGRMHDQGTWWVSGSIEGMSGLYTKEQLGALLLGVVEVYETGALKIMPTSMISEGDVVAAEAESFARLTTGKVYNNRYHFRFTVQDGKVKEVREYMDTMHARETFFPS